ncbi:MAG: PQQ-binding-like beta-propeller repeat protein [Kouleothrix sp.]|nr:PQQ-binding-like beta-propeller repeat protein [Kouleothrix sp.]
MPISYRCAAILLTLVLLSGCSNAQTTLPTSTTIPATGNLAASVTTNELPSIVAPSEQPTDGSIAKEDSTSTVGTDIPLTSTAMPDAVVADLPSTSNGTMPRGDIGLSGVTAISGINAPGDLHTVASDFARGTTPLIVDSIAYVQKNRSLIAIDLQDGKQLWSYDRQKGEYAISSVPPVVAGDVIYTWDNKGWLVALHRKDGHIIIPPGQIQGQIQGVTQTIPIIDNGTLYVSASDGLLALDPMSGARRWKYDLQSLSSPIIVGDLVVVRPSSGEIHAVSKENGQIKWRYTLKDHSSKNETVLNAITAAGRVFFVDGEHIYALDATNGHELWVLDRVTFLSAIPVATKDTVFIAAQINNSQDPVGKSVLLALDATTGTERWSLNQPGAITTAPTVANNTVYIASSIGDNQSENTGIVSAVDAANGGERWSVPLAVAVSGDLTLATQGIFFISRFGALSYLAERPTPTLATDFEAAPTATIPISEHLVLDGRGAIGKTLFFPDGQRMLTFSDNAFAIWRIADGFLLRLQALEPYAIASADLSPDGAYIAIMASSQWSDNDMLFVWRVADGTLIAAQVIPGQPAQFASFLPGTRTIALSPHRSSSSSADTALNMQIVQFAETGGQWTTLRAVPLQRPINMLGIAPDGKSLAVDGDREVQIWSVDTLQPQQSLIANGEISSIMFTHDNQMLIAYSGGSTQRWRIADGKSLDPLSLDRLLPLGVSDNGLLATQREHPEGNTVDIWRLTDSKIVQTIQVEGNPDTITPDGNAFIANYASNIDSALHIYHLTSSR